MIGGVDRPVTNQQKKRKLQIDQYERYKNRKVEESEDIATVNTLKNVAGSCDDDDAFELASERYGDKVFAAITEPFDARVTLIHAVQTLMYWQMYQKMKTHHQSQKDFSGEFCLMWPSVACALDRRSISDR